MDCYASRIMTRRDVLTHGRRPFIIVLALCLVAAASTQAPELRIVAPAEGATVMGPNVTVLLEVEGVVLGGRARNGAYALLTLDEMPPVKSYSPRFTFRGVAGGSHRLQVELRRAEGGTFDPPVKGSASFQVDGARGF